MGKLRLDIVNPKRGIHIKLDEALGEVDNGAFVQVGELVDDSEYRDCRKGVALTAGALEVAIIAHDGHRYEKLDMGNDVKVEKGGVTRAYVLHGGQEVTIEKARLDAGTYQVGTKLAVVAGGVKLGVAKDGTSSTAGDKVIAVVDALEKDDDGTDMVVIKFL